ncbi:MAG: phytanoyl-CoA dioxygenase family protein [Rhodopirellula sp.]|nr:phytanoyl-CoA dioxygenase family protein [Rhodopirellula sp.]
MATSAGYEDLWQDFQQHGYLIIRQLLDSTTVHALQETIDKIMLGDAD